MVSGVQGTWFRAWSTGCVVLSLAYRVHVFESTAYLISRERVHSFERTGYGYVVSHNPMPPSDSSEAELFGQSLRNLKD